MPSANPASADDLDLLFREVVLVLGGVFAVRRTDDETVRRVARGIERVYVRLRQREADTRARRTSAAAPHPEIERLLRLAESGEAGR